MRFVDDEDLVAVAGGAEADIFAQFAHFVDAAIGGRVDFNDVDGIALQGFDAGRAFAARIGRRAFHTIQAAGHDARDRGLAGSALAGKDVPMGDTALGDGVIEGGFDVLLPYQLIKIAGTVFAGDDLIGHG